MYGEGAFIYVIVMRILNTIINPNMVLVSKFYRLLSEFTAFENLSWDHWEDSHHRK